MKPDTCDAAIALFIRQPIAGRVKTRLASDLGAEAACELYRAMVDDVLVAAAGSGMPLVLFHDGEDHDGLPARWISAAARVLPQEGTLLGERMTAAFERLFVDGVVKVILIGSDIPGIDVELLQSAAAALDKHDVTLSPAPDGGYCLVASKKDCFDSRIFLGIPWSTDRVMASTIDVCTRHGLSYALLEPRQDIDTISDLVSYCRNPSVTAVATNAWLQSRGLIAAST